MFFKIWALLNFAQFFIFSFFSSFTYAHDDFANYAQFSTPKFNKKAQKYLFPIEQTSSLHLFRFPPEAFAAKVQAILSAKKSIHIQYLDIRSDESNALIAELLKIKAAEGVNVQIIVDAVQMLVACLPVKNCSALMRDLSHHPNIKVYGVSDNMFEQVLNELNYPPPSLNKRLHEKALIIDGLTDHGLAILGGSNIANKFAQISDTSQLRWWDQDLMVKGPVVLSIEKGFLWNLAHFASKKAKWHLDWQEKRWGPIEGEQTRDLSSDITALFKQTEPWGNAVKEQRAEFRQMTRDLLAKAPPLFTLPLATVPMRYFQHRPKAKERLLHELHLHLFEQAQKEILLVNSYMILSSSMLRLLKKAVRRGVKVYLISNGRESTDHTITVDFFNLQQYQLLRVNKEKASLRSGGKMMIASWRGREIGLGTIHSKMAVIDGKVAFVGSYNFDYRSRNLNSENGLLFGGEAAAEARAIFMEEYIPRAKEVDLKTAKHHIQTLNPLHILRNILIVPLEYIL